MDTRTSQFDLRCDVVIVGAGPVGLLTANYLGAQGINVIVIDGGSALIDYPRGVGMDDECLRSFQAVGLSDAVLPHTTSFHWMRFVTGSGRCFASIEPRTDEFGWPRRNAFIQPLADRVLLDGLARYPHVSVRFSHTLESFTQDANSVTLRVKTPDGDTRISARYLVGADGGRSTVRKVLDIPFEGKTDANRWVVIDLRNDPLGTPNAYMHCDPARPYVSIALPHGIRRFEFMLFPGEAEGDVVSPETLRLMLSRVLPDPDRIDMIRARVYTHNGRLAARFRQDRAILAGDAAHIMPVWQGQGYNSGMRDATNLGWKLAMVINGLADDALLDTYGEERREHAAAMIALSQTAGKIFSPTNRAVAALRDGVTWLLNYIPPVKRYFVEMRFKPMPRYRSGALVYPAGVDTASPVGRMFIQPRVTTDIVALPVKLDEVLGTSFAIVCWGNDPTYWMSAETRQLWQRLGTRIISVRPNTQLAHELARQPEGVTIVADTDGRLKEWFGNHSASVVFLRPDRFVAGMCLPQQIDAMSLSLEQALHVTDQPAHQGALDDASHAAMPVALAANGAG
ncbi:bifunctional 3-(3-hydroxy-phenyl)propionate/3-hydroxycinnamic acid hydroxylase [Actimicrobium antarcticum]|uniref:Bifunctional 3-(3-hydroxy-phenyl)propionate/3-hydroxycinnamic acid hydroxylase n=1 Tax=Actimicrobium antarcticum TaxID=1051899 RepID=A0ABP7TI68_9BURK